MTDNVLDQAHARLDGGRRWTQNGLHDGDRWCVIGALCDARRDVRVLGGMEALAAVIREQYPERVTGGGVVGVVGNFNDHPDTTWADVDVVLDKAARLLDEQVSP